MARVRSSKRAPTTRKSRSPRRTQATAPSSSSEHSAPAPSGEGRLDHRDSGGRREIIVRMYRQGLGDCFLLALPTDDVERPKYLLIDCGVHTRETRGTERLGQVLRNLVVATGGQLDVVVATHEHADHLSGFVQKASPFLTDELKVASVWLAWTEQRGDKDADALRLKRGTADEVIQSVLRQKAEKTAAVSGRLTNVLGAVEDFEHPDPNSIDRNEVVKRIENLSQGNPGARKYLEPGESSRFLGVAKGKKTKEPTSNELALGLLSAKAGALSTNYFEPGQVVNLDGVSGLRAYVLGPPRPTGTKGDLLSRSDPQKIRGRKESDPDGQYNEVYLSGRGGASALSFSPVLKVATEGNLPEDFQYPFALQHRRKYQLSERAGESPDWDWPDHSQSVPEATRSLLEKTYLDPTQAWRRIDSDWLQSTEQLALNLNGDTNNTSLVLAFEWGPPGKGQVLLFPGDAQVGNWLSWRGHKYSAGDVTVSADDLMRRTILYKVGHHGSHNATVRRDSREVTPDYPLGVPFGLELMNDIVAMIPVDDQAARQRTQAWEMPAERLYRRLREKARLRVLRADAFIEPLKPPEQPDLVPQSNKWQPIPGLPHARWRRATENFAVGDNLGPLYYDVAIALEK